MANPAPRDRLLTLEEYLELEDRSDVRHEYVAGEVHAMTGVTRRHSRITGNLFARLWAVTRGGPCRVHQGEVKLRLGDVVYYPDVMVACGPEPRDPRLEDAPCLVVEVLSPSTEHIDRREKLRAYLEAASVEAYLVVAQDERLVEHYSRDADGVWRHATLLGGDALALRRPALTLTVDEIYEGVAPPSPEERRRVREAEALYG